MRNSQANFVLQNNRSQTTLHYVIGVIFSEVFVKYECQPCLAAAFDCTSAPYAAVATVWSTTTWLLTVQTSGYSGQLVN